MTLANFLVQSTPEIDNSIVVKADSDEQRVVAYIPREAIDDCFPGGPFTDDERVKLVEDNLTIVSKIIDRKYAGGIFKKEYRFGSIICRIEVSMTDFSEVIW